MITLEDTLKLAAVIILSAGLVRYRYGPIWPKIKQRLGPHWPLIVKIGSVATLAIWILLWALADPEQGGGLHQIFGENSPWSRSVD